jgi:hypothetical protein
VTAPNAACREEWEKATTLAKEFASARNVDLPVQTNDWWNPDSNVKESLGSTNHERAAGTFRVFAISDVHTDTEENM